MDHGGPQEPDFRNCLYQVLVGDAQPDRILGKCWLWYTGYLDAQIKECFHSTLAPTIVGLNSLCTEDGSRWVAQAAIVYSILTIVAEEIRLRREASIDSIILELDSKRLLKRADGHFLTDDEQNAARQMVWHLVGILTMLYDPMRSTNCRELKVHQPLSSLRGRGRHRKRVLSTFSQSIAKSEEQFHSLLGHFGELLPEAEDMSSNAPLAGSTDNHLNIAYVSFHGLKNVAKLNIEWVNVMNLHLQLDQRKRILRLYRFPAFCRLLWQDDDESCLLQRLFQDHRTSLVASVPTDAARLGISDFLREIILSYRLIFGMDKSSRRAFEGELEAWARDKSHSTPLSSRRLYEMDPLLKLVCQSPSPNPNSPSDLLSLLELLDGEETSTLYPFEEFPFLGKRLAELQRFSIAHKPNDWKSLVWIDRRDVKNFWSIWIAWAVLIVGGATIILQAFQLAFQVWSSIVAFHELNLERG
ncbi:hypothetical protein, variant [Exophiala mesophila]|nr:hypothetical protein, variant [Exophiala mesophila]KIV90278.1 hypothetical protein, variant [Exophiala mesophila]